jgi:hypothetical protein
MRGFTFLSLAGAVALGACTEQDHQPTAPPKPVVPAAEVTSVPCPPTFSFPINNVVKQIKALFPGGRLRDQATSQASAIRDNWQRCRVATARDRASTFVTFILLHYEAEDLIGGKSATTEGRKNTLISTVYTGVGLPGGDFGSDVYVGDALLIKTLSGNAAVFLPDDAFTEPTVITIVRLPDESNPLNPPEGTPQFPPFYDITASNSSNTHVLAGEREAVVGFCVDDSVLPDADLSDPQIGHRRFDDVFEILPAATAGEYAGLELECSIQGNDEIGTITMQGRTDLQDLAVAAWRAAAPYVRPLVEEFVLPERLHATMVGHVGLGGRTTSFSPFGVVDAGVGETF